MTESQEGFDVHVYPGIPSAAIEDFVLDKNEGLAELVPDALKEFLKSVKHLMRSRPCRNFKKKKLKKIHSMACSFAGVMDT